MCHFAGDTIELPYGCVALQGCRANGFIAENGDPTNPLIPESRNKVKGKKGNTSCVGSNTG